MSLSETTLGRVQTALERRVSAPNLPTVLQDDGERLNERLAETQMLAFKWMEAHDKLHAGKQYKFPSPADLPDALEAKEREIERLREALQAARRLFSPIHNTALCERIDAALQQVGSNHD